MIEFGLVLINSEKHIKMSTTASILETLQDKIKVWQNLKSNEISTKFLPSMSNTVYLVHVKPEFSGKILENEPSRILYREFATGLLDELISRRLENKLFKYLAGLGLGPQLLYVDKAIRIEEFINGEPISCDDMVNPDVQLLLLKELVKYHTLKPTDLEQISPFDKFIHSMKMHQLIKEKRINTKFEDQENLKIDEMLKFFNKQFFDKIKSEMNVADEDLIISHNDLLNGNIMRMGPDNFTLIDYEYMGFNFPGFDIANYCNECMYDYTFPSTPFFNMHKEKRPSGDDLVKLYKLYIIFFEKCKNEVEFKSSISSFNDDETLDKLWNENLEKYEKLLQKYLKLHKYNLIVSHLYWLLWGIVVSKNPKITFDYIEFSWQRYQDILEVLEE